MFLQPFLAGGVSIALQKNATAVRPLCCGDPLRRLVAKCFCLGAKSEISSVFRGKNYGVGCRPRRLAAKRCTREAASSLVTTRCAISWTASRPMECFHLD